MRSLLLSWFKVVPLLAAFLISSCASLPHPPSGKDRLDLRCELLEVPDPRSLAAAALPASGLSLGSGGKLRGIERFRELVAGFNEREYSLLDEIFGEMLSDRAYRVKVVATQGVPAPYDAWTAEWNGEVAVFFNLSLWTEAGLEKSGMSVIRHEVAHVLLRDVLPPFDRADPLALLDHLVINEGIAHFVGYSRGLSDLREKSALRWGPAERELAVARARLGDASLGALEREEILRRANAGPFWEKFAAVAGLFRVWEIYSISGAAGLRGAVWRGKLGNPKSGSFVIEQRLE